MPSFYLDAMLLRLRCNAVPVAVDPSGNRTTSLTARRPRIHLVGRSHMACKAQSDDLSAEAVVQRQLEAYNARDIEAFMAVLADDCIATNAVSGAVLAQGSAELRQRYESRFQTQVHSQLLNRVCLGPVVVDREVITGLPNGEVADCLAIYHCREGKIQRMEFVWESRPQ